MSSCGTSDDVIDVVGVEIDVSKAHKEHVTIPSLYHIKTGLNAGQVVSITLSSFFMSILTYSPLLEMCTWPPDSSLHLSFVNNLLHLWDRPENIKPRYAIEF